MRAAYAEVTAAGLTEDTANYSKDVKLTQQQEGWQNTSIKDIGGHLIEKDDTLKNVAGGQTITVKYIAPTKDAAADVKFEKKGA